MRSCRRRLRPASASSTAAATAAAPASTAARTRSACRRTRRTPPPSAARRSITAAGYIYASETWWNSAARERRPAARAASASAGSSRGRRIQNGFTSSSMRSVPDVATNADPATAACMICQASARRLPERRCFTAAPASRRRCGRRCTALLNQAHGAEPRRTQPRALPARATRLRSMTPASMGSDFAHVGLGSPNFGALHLAAGEPDGGRRRRHARRTSPCS